MGRDIKEAHNDTRAQVFFKKKKEKSITKCHLKD